MDMFFSYKKIFHVFFVLSKKLPPIKYYVNKTGPYAKNKDIKPILCERIIKMDISDIRIRKILQDGRLRAVVSMTLDNAVAVHDIKIVQGDERVFVAMPSRRDESGAYRDIIHPISPEARSEIERRIITEYERYVGTDGGSFSKESSRL